jgi:hypothetical protein
MIGHVWASGGGFKGIIRYMLTGDKGLSRVEDRVEWMGFVNLPTRDPEVAACMMAATADSSVSNTKTPIYHFSVSCAPEDPVDRDMLRRIAERTIRDLGLREYEIAVFAHKDRPHPHLHFVVNRVHPERRTLWSPWRDHYRIEHSLRAQEREFGLRIVPGWLAPVPEPEQGRARTVQGPQRERAAEAQRPRPSPRRGEGAFLADVRKRALPVLEQARSWAELQRGLAEQGLSLRVKGGGFRVGDDRSDVKASDVARAFSRHHLEQRFGSFPDYHARMAVTVPTRVPSVPEVAVPDASARHEIPAPAPADPPARTVEPAPAPTPHPVERTTPEPEPAQPPHLPTRRPVELPAPVPRPPRPLTERERYRVALDEFTARMAALYRDPRTARRSFAADVRLRGAAEAVRALASTPDVHGPLGVLASRERALEAARWGEVYARWQEGRTRLVARIVSDLYHAADVVDAADRASRDAEANAHKAGEVRAGFTDRQRREDVAGGSVLNHAHRVYADSDAAVRDISQHVRVHGREATYDALESHPERFGRLRAEERRVLWILRRQDTTEARKYAPLLAESLRTVYAVWDARPTAEEVTRADEAQQAAAAAVEAAGTARRALPATTAHEFQQMAARVMQHAVRGSPARERALMRQLAAMLSHGAFSLSRKALASTGRSLDEPEREQRHTDRGTRRSDRGTGFEF